jgi:hypothetical protein
MRTTVEMPDPLFRRAKATASLRGVTLRELVTQAVEHEISTGELGLLRGGRPVQLPLVPSSRPGKRNLTTDKVAEILEKDDLRALARR